MKCGKKAMSLSIALLLCVTPALADGGETASSVQFDSRMDDELVFTGEDDFRFLGFEDLRDKVLEGSLTARMLEESIASIDAIDFTQMYLDMTSQLRSLEYAQNIYGSIPVASEFEGAMQGYVIQNLQSTYDTLRGSLSQLSTGDLQKDYAAAKRQLKNAQNLTVVGAESLYIAILDLEQAKGTLQRNLDALERMIQEMELRHTLGQISDLSLEQTYRSKAELESSLETLELNLRTCKVQLQSMTGESLNGSLVLGELPAISEALVDSMNQKLDLSEAKDHSYELFAAKKKLDDASDDYDDVREEHAQNTYNTRSARHTYEAALYEYKTAVQNFEMNFREVFEEVKDYQQLLEAAETALTYQRHTYAAAEEQYRLGLISRQTLLQAADELSEAEDAVASAERNRFTAYRSYYWMVNYGVTS